VSARAFIIMTRYTRARYRPSFDTAAYLY